MDNWRADGSVTLVGSMPHQDRKEAIDLVIRAVPEIPVWPQLPAYKSEQMMIQYLEGLPGIQEGAEDLRVKTDSAQIDQELYSFYEEYLEVQAGSKNLAGSRFQLGPETGKTFYRFMEVLSRLDLPCKAVKGQIVGPFTLLSGLKDQRDRALLYDERFVDVVAKHLAMKAKWQVRQLESLGHPVILFLDEPALAGFGSSAFISVSRELVQGLLTEVVDAVHAAGALAGIHVCANTDWLLAFDSSVDIINFDAYHYFEKFALYKDHIARFISMNRKIAWGMVPTSDPATIIEESAQRLADRWVDQVAELFGDQPGLGEILSCSLFTPSCGCASLSREMAERVIRLTHELGQIMRRQA